MGFTLRIYLAGLMAIVPNENLQEMRILLVDARQGHETSDQQTISAHQPLLFSRAAHCEGDCWIDEEANFVSNFISQGQIDETEVVEVLRSAVLNGGIWRLDQEELSIFTDQSSSAEGLHILLDEPLEGQQESLSWVASIETITPASGSVASDLLASQATSELVAARLKLSEGSIRPYRFVTYGSRIAPIVFKSIDGSHVSGQPPQPFADWLVIDIAIPGCNVDILARRFVGEANTRSMGLSPASCTGQEVVEVALLNLPAEGFRVYSDEGQQAVMNPIGRHFEMYYNLASSQPAEYLLPHVAEGWQDTEWDEWVPQSALEDSSSLLPAIGVTHPRGSYSGPICPTAIFAAHPDA